MMWLIKLAINLGIPERFAKPLLIVLAAVLLIGGLGIGKCSYDKSVIEKHAAKQDAANAKADRKADAVVAEQRRKDDARLTQEAQQLERTQDNAKTDADRRVARHHCLRLQQAARRDGKQPPTCA